MAPVLLQVIKKPRLGFPTGVSFLNPVGRSHPVKGVATSHQYKLTIISYIHLEGRQP
jgi:hypothetical protein